MTVCLPQAKAVAYLGYVLTILAVHLVEVLQADAVALRDAMHRVAIAYDVVGILLGGLLVFLFQLDDVAIF